MAGDIYQDERESLISPPEQQTGYSSEDDVIGAAKGSSSQSSSGGFNSRSPIEGEVVEYDALLDHDVVPETATTGRNLGWSSAYIIIASRMLGTGVFATPGSI